MRLWSIHPKYLDARGLVALWREALLAQAVLLGRTKGYTHHPQLLRFRSAGNPKDAIAGYLRVIHAEALSRGYGFDVRRIASRGSFSETISVTRGQVQYEWQHLRRKLAERDPDWLEKLCRKKRVIAHPAFAVVPGDVEHWEKVL